MIMADHAAGVRANSHGHSGNMVAGGWRSSGSTVGCECRGTPLVQSFDWPTVAVAVAAVPFLKAPSRHSHSCRLAPGENLIFADRAVAASHGRILLGGTALEAWLRCGPVHLSIVLSVGWCVGVRHLCILPWVCVLCMLFGLSVVIGDGALYIKRGETLFQ